MGIHVFACDMTARDYVIDNITYICMNVADEQDIQRVYTLLSDQGVVLDAIIHIAGIFDIDSFIEADNSLLRRMFEVNFLGAMYVNKILYPLLSKNGRIVITTSEVAPLDPMSFNGFTMSPKQHSMLTHRACVRNSIFWGKRSSQFALPGAFRTPLSQGSLEKPQQLTQKLCFAANSRLGFMGC